MRGWSSNRSAFQAISKICPAYAGMIPYKFFVLIFSVYLSRVCGDDPTLWFCTGLSYRFVPRMRGWSLCIWNWRQHEPICPAYAGMILWRIARENFRIYLSRVCGDDPGRLDLLETETEFVPRMRGWSYKSFQEKFNTYICPAYAGMILLCQKRLIINTYLSRVCGDDPIAYLIL